MSDDKTNQYLTDNKSCYAKVLLLLKVLISTEIFLLQLLIIYWYNFKIQKDNQIYRFFVKIVDLYNIIPIEAVEKLVIPKMSAKQALAIHSSITKFRPELFVEFCAYLTPSDLFILSKVCRQFYCYLSAPNSFSTQQIWKRSRLKFMTNDLMPPPNGMNEECYVELLINNRTKLSNL
ncbi:14805_t:CDS:2 [Funneliformis geosporum]|nr:14805_t:CDS:2 [Funneliformis geosporum]